MDARTRLSKTTCDTIMDIKAKLFDVIGETIDDYYGVIHMSKTDTYITPHTYFYTLIQRCDYLPFIYFMIEINNINGLYTIEVDRKTLKRNIPLPNLYDKFIELNVLELLENHILKHI